MDNLVDLDLTLKGNNLTWYTGEILGTYLPLWNNLIELNLDLENNEIE